MGSMAGVTGVLVLLLAAVPAFATDYTVGDSSGWSTGVDYNTWAAGKTFNVGDTLLFQYSPLHSVNEVSKSDYTGCSASNSIQTYNDQNTKISLTAAGSRYFICGTPGHCSGGMKLAVTVSGSSSGGTPSTTPSTPGGSTPTPSTPTSTPTTPSTPTTTPPASSNKNAATGGRFHGGNALLLGALLVGLALLG